MGNLNTILRGMKKINSSGVGIAKAEKKEDKQSKKAAYSEFKAIINGIGSSLDPVLQAMKQKKKINGPTSTPSGPGLFDALGKDFKRTWNDLRLARAIAKKHGLGALYDSNRLTGILGTVEYQGGPANLYKKVQLKNNPAKLAYILNRIRNGRDLGTGIAALGTAGAAGGAAYWHMKENEGVMPSIGK